MAYSLAEFRMVEDHVAQGERHVIRQEEIIAWLKSHGHSTEAAEELLASFRDTLSQHRAHRDKMLRSMTGNCPDT